MPHGQRGGRRAGLAKATTSRTSPSSAAFKPGRRKGIHTGNSGGGERVTRSSRAKLTNGLEDPAQVEKELNAQLRSMGLYAANITGDGNCLFRALSDQLYGYPHQHAVLRQSVCDYLEARSDKFAAFIDVEKPFEEYVRSMRQSGTYGGHLELSAFAQLKQKEIKIVQPGLVYIISGDDESPQALQERERREKEREAAQSRSVPGSEGPPPTERALRQMRRARKGDEWAATVATRTTTGRGGVALVPHASTSSQTIEDEGSVTVIDLMDSDETTPLSVSPAASGSTESVDEVDRQTALATSTNTITPAIFSDRASAYGEKVNQIEAFGPLWIAYHNWEHYSSIRNIEGPHAGLPRINEKRASLLPSGGGKALSARSNPNKRSVAVGGEEGDSEPTEEETLVLRSTSGYTLQQVRFYIKQHGGWEEALEAILANEVGEDENGEDFDDDEGRSESRGQSDHLKPVESSVSRFSASPAALPSESQSNTEGASSGRTSHSPMPDHMRDWRALSPSSVDTTGTHSSVESASASTHATTDDSPDAAGGSGSSSKQRTPSDARRSKRTASKEPTSSLRSPKRRSRSRSPVNPDHAGLVAAHAIANIRVHSGEHTPVERQEYMSSPLSRPDEYTYKPAVKNASEDLDGAVAAFLPTDDEQVSLSSSSSTRPSRRTSGTTSACTYEDPNKTPRAKMAVTPRHVSRTLTMRERREMRKAEKVRKALDAKAKRQQSASVADDEEDTDEGGTVGLFKHHSSGKGFLELKI